MIDTEIQELADLLLKQGYRVISRKYCIIARIDCTPKAYLQRLQNMYPDNRSLQEFFTPSWFDYYHRCVAKDRKKVDERIVRCMTKRSWSQCTFQQAFAKHLKQTSVNIGV